MSKFLSFSLEIFVSVFWLFSYEKLPLADCRAEVYLHLNLRCVPFDRRNTTLGTDCLGRRIYMWQSALLKLI